jgi:hypothetical protein
MVVMNKLSKAEVCITAFLLIAGILIGINTPSSKTNVVEGKSRFNHPIGAYSNVDIYTDAETKLQYIVFENTSGGIYAIPRLDENGKQIKEK